jgi:hypothetical protein
MIYLRNRKCVRFECLNILFVTTKKRKPDLAFLFVTQIHTYFFYDS